MLAWRRYKDSICGGCGQPKAHAWHPDNDGWFEVEHRITCHACTALERARHEDSKEPAKPVEYLQIVDTRDYDAQPLAPYDPT